MRISLNGIIRVLPVLGFWALMEGCTPPVPDAVDEASGIVRSGDSLLIVDDSLPGAYFTFSLQGDSGPMIPIDPQRTKLIQFPDAGHIDDLEAIEVLGDGRIVMLSERLHALYAKNVLVAQYDNALAENDGRGLEGIAVKDLPEGGSRIAVLWEGGYPHPNSQDTKSQTGVEKRARRSIILVHDLSSGQEGCQVTMDSARIFTELELPMPEGQEPEAQRFRAPDLAWFTSVQDGGQDDGFIVLLSSMSGNTPPSFKYHWLQRFSLSGMPVGEPLDLDAVVPPQLEGVNWEGLSWFEEGQSLVLIHETDDVPQTYAYVLPIPDEWKAPIPINR